jgi:hypothetical protein
MRRHYQEDRWLGQKFYPILIVEKDTMEPVCQAMARRWQMPFASSRGYSSLKLQHDVAEMLKRRRARTGQAAVILFVSDLDPSGWRNTSRTRSICSIRSHRPIRTTPCRTVCVRLRRMIMRRSRMIFSRRRRIESGSASAGRRSVSAMPIASTAPPGLAF